MNRTKDEYYLESKRLRSEVLTMAETLKGEPLHFTITNMQRFDPPSEDDMGDNGMSRYMNAYDDEDWE